MDEGTLREVESAVQRLHHAWRQEVLADASQLQGVQSQR